MSMIYLGLYECGLGFGEATAGALALWGDQKQAFSCVGELNELGALLVRYGQGRAVSNHAIREEIADALITLEQMAQAFFREPADLANVIGLKLQKLAANAEESVSNGGTRESAELFAKAFAGIRKGP